MICIMDGDGKLQSLWDDRKTHFYIFTQNRQQENYVQNYHHTPFQVCFGTVLNNSCKYAYIQGKERINQSFP